jgi:hypothetical protein
VGRGRDTHGEIFDPAWWQARQQDRRGGGDGGSDAAPYPDAARLR